MITLDKTTRKLQAVLTSSPATQCDVAVSFYDTLLENQQGAEERPRRLQVATTNNTTDVDICDAPPRYDVVRNIENICVHNKHSASVTVKIKIDDGGTDYILVAVLLATLESLVYEATGGWQVI